MGKVLPALLVVLISACAANAIELRPSNDPTDQPFGMAGFAAAEGVTKDKWRKIKADISSELPKLTKCHSNLDECSTSTVRKFEEIVKVAETQGGLAKIAFINAVINAMIDYESDRAQWGVADEWTLPFVNKKGAFETGHGDCEDYALGKYVALRQAGVRAEDVRMVLVHDYAVGVDHAILTVRYDKRWLILDNRWDKLVEDKELTQFKALAAVDGGGVTTVTKDFIDAPSPSSSPFTLSSKMNPAAGRPVADGTAQSRPPPTQMCRACVLGLSACLRCTEQNKSTSDGLKCVNACNDKNRCVRGVTCKPESS
jgi:predicted transglutaminase-like cysteine proteinase